MKGIVLLLAAGEGTRIGTPKAFIDIAGIPMLRHAANAAAAADLVDAIVVAVADDARDRATEVLDGLAVPFSVIAGGDTRQASARAALVAAPDAAAYAVHDAARALCPPFLFDACLLALDSCKAVCPGVPITDTIKEVSDGVVSSTLDRAKLVAVQTPQTFHADVYRRAHEAAQRDGIIATDDCALVERIGVPVHIIAGETSNLKITTPDDLVFAESFLR